jgi:DNA-binding NtrC family response regulator
LLVRREKNSHGATLAGIDDHVNIRAIVLDDGFMVADRAQVVLPAADIRVDHVRSVAELGAAFAAGQPCALLIANVTATAGGWELWQQIRQARFGGPKLVLLQEAALPIAEDFEEVPGTECLPLPLSTAQLDQVLLSFVMAATSHAPRSTGRAAERTEPVNGMVGRSAALRAILARIE